MKQNEFFEVSSQIRDILSRSGIFFELIGKDKDHPVPAYLEKYYYDQYSGAPMVGVRTKEGDRVGVPFHQLETLVNDWKEFKAHVKNLNDTFPYKEISPFNSNNSRYETQ